MCNLIGSPHPPQAPPPQVKCEPLAPTAVQLGAWLETHTSPSMVALLGCP